MHKDKKFCVECREVVTYTVKETVLEANLKGEIYHYNGKVAHCDNCGSEIYIGEINDYNLEQLYNQYRERNGLISLYKVREIPVKYNIGAPAIITFRMGRTYINALL